MSNSKMLIDATHPEETRVVVVRGGRVEEFDYESAARKLLRGNIYLAKVTRVEPSLQAAFVEYGGNRHGFLAFNEIHPDYYQIPVADRQALIDEDAAAEAEEEAEADAHAEARAQSSEQPAAADDQPVSEAADVPRSDDDAVSESAGPGGNGHDGDSRGAEPASYDDGDGDGEGGGVQEVGPVNGEAEPVEEVSTEEDALEEVPSRPRRRMRSYKIQEVIKRRQVVLVQVVKEERGNKGAALTTYLSLAGRYTVLMPNTARGGGISRKITNPGDRKRLKAIANELDVPEGMGLIIRTAGAARTKQEIKRDYEYLLRLWESVRDLTLQSTAPSLVYEEGNLIKRSIRDHFTKDVDEVVVAGDGAYSEAHDFMRMLMPSHARSVIHYKDAEPLFARHQVERQLSAMFSPFVTLRSGGYLVINQTEALVAIDINSGKSTREFSIEETALNTNLEAAEEIARQLKLRDLAGLIVIDFIDMEEKRNNRAVERRLKDALRFDRARIQVGRISHFGLLEMSRQRLRTGVLEGSTTQCPHCQGTGIVRSTESVALAVLRGIEDALMANPRQGVSASTTAAVAIYILNNKRAYINELEGRYGVAIVIQASDKLHGANFTVDRTNAPAQVPRKQERAVVNMDWGFEGESEAAEAEEADGESEVEEVGAGNVEEVDDRDDRDDEDSEHGGENGRRGRRRRRRRGRRGDRPENGESAHADEAHDERPRGDRERPALPTPREVAQFTSYAMQAADIAAGGDGIGTIVAAPRFEEAMDDDGGQGRRGRRRGRRGGRRGRGDGRHEHGHHSGNGGDFEAGSGEPPRAPIAGQGPQPDVDMNLPGAESRPMRRNDRWRDRRGGRDRWRRDDDQAGHGAAPGPSAAIMAASIAAGLNEEPAAAMAPAAVEPVVQHLPIVAVLPAVADVVTEAAVAIPVAAAAPETPAEAPPPAPRARRISDSTASSEPKLERVVIGPERAAEMPAEAPPPAAPARKGWWQRKFGG